jgi:mRNA interferase MazF
MAKRKKTKKQEIIFPKRGEIYLVNFDPTIGAEIKKTRPALILQNNIANRYSPVTIVAAITSKNTEDLYPTEVLLSGGGLRGLEVESKILLNQLRTIDKSRLIKHLGRISGSEFQKLNTALEISLGLVDLE